MPNSSQILFEIIPHEKYKDGSYNGYIRFRRPCRVNEFIKEWLLDENQHGKIKIENTKFEISFSNGECEPLPKYILKCMIKHASAKRIDGDSVLLLVLKDET